MKNQYEVLGKAPGREDLKKLSNENVHLTIKNLSAGYGKMEILHNFDLFINKAQSLCLIGPNGAGKSTILHSIYGFTNIFSGQIEINGKEITNLTPAEKLKSVGIAYILQDNSVFPDMTVEENLLMGGYIKNRTEESYKEMEKIFEKYERLRNRRSQPAKVLSGGERRRLALAQALAQNPKIFLLDEPLNHLDPQHQIEVMKLFSKKLKHGKSIIASMHDINLVNRFADRCLLLYGNGNWKLGLTKNVLSPEILSELYEVEIKLINSNGSYFFTSV